MGAFSGWISEIQIDERGEATAWIQCPQGRPPAAGQYLMAWASEDLFAPLATPLFASEITQHSFRTAPPIPKAWQPGTQLSLRGPNGHGFEMPERTRRLALAALGDSASRLLPLASDALQADRAVTLYTNASLPSLPAAVEVYPLESLPEALTWADFLALDLPVELLVGLRRLLSCDIGEPLPCPAQALLSGPMPCGAASACGACALPARRSWKLACQDGPVFALDELDW